VKIIGRYVLKEHVGPFVFASTALTSLMLLQYIAKRFGELVGKGLPAGVIAEFMALSLPFTIAMTLPMAVLVAVLYAFSRLAAENETTAAVTRSFIEPSVRAGGSRSRLPPAGERRRYCAAYAVACGSGSSPRANVCSSVSPSISSITR